MTSAFSASVFQNEFLPEGATEVNAVVTVTQADKDTLSLVVSASSLTVAEGGTNTFTVRLSAQPTSSVSITTSRTGGATVLGVASGGALTFTTGNWSFSEAKMMTRPKKTWSAKKCSKPSRNYRRNSTTSARF